MAKTPLLLLSAALLVGIREVGANDSRRPATTETFSAGQAAPLTGTWSYTASEIRMPNGGKIVVCGMSGVTLTLQQRDTALIGSTRGGVVKCQGRPDRPVTDAPVTEGVVRQRNVSFRLGPFVHRGTVSQREVKGSLTIPSQRVTGRFRLTRQ